MTRHKNGVMCKPQFYLVYYIKVIIEHLRFRMKCRKTYLIVICGELDFFNFFRERYLLLLKT